MKNERDFDNMSCQEIIMNISDNISDTKICKKEIRKEDSRSRMK